MTLWTVKEIAAVLGCAGGFDEVPVSAVSIDTRTLKAGEVFVALSGTPSGGFVSSFASSGDGHQWVKAAEDKGAAAVVVSRRVDGVGIPQLVVGDTLIEGLWKLAAAARERFKGKVIGLTGSAGKSGTKEFLAAMLEGSHAPKASYNNFWGVPLTLCNMPADAPFAIIEMGMNRPGEIERLSRLARPDVALVVNVRPVHLEALGSVEAIRLEKLGICAGLTAGGALVVPMDLALDGVVGVPSRVVRFAPDERGGAEVFARDWHAHGVDWHVDALVDGVEVDFMLQDGAPHRLWNALAALASVWAAGADVRACAGRIGLTGVMEGRGVTHSAGGVVVIDDSFNGNPASMAAAILGLKSRVVHGRRLAILGDMLELGAEAPRYHAELAPLCEGLDGVYCVGPLMKNLYNALPEQLRLGWHEEPSTLAPVAVAGLLRVGDMVVIKGSKRIFWVYSFAKRLLEVLEK